MAWTADSSPPTADNGFWTADGSNGTFASLTIGSAASNGPVGTIGAAVSYPPISFTDLFTLGWNVTPLIPQFGVTLGNLTATFIEGHISSSYLFTPQTITSTEGVLTVSTSTNESLALGPINALFVEGIPLLSIGYILDLSTVTLVGQTAAFSEGAIVATPTYTFSNQTITSTEGVIVQTNEVQVTLGSESITSSEGVITAQAGSNFNANLSAQTITSTEFFALPPATVSYTAPSETVTSTEGIVTFSNTNNFSVNIGSVAAVFAEGSISAQVPQGTGPPLFIPPQLGKPVTTRTFSWSEMAQRAWGSEFRAPDHRIYQFSGGNYKDSTDLGTTGIYSPNLGPQDNPPPSQ